MKIKRVIASCMLSSPLVLLAACGSDDQAANLTGVPASSFTLNISDGPVDNATTVVVEFTGVSIKSAGSEEPTVVEFDEPKSIDLLSLQGTAYESLLSEIELEPGDYEWVRLHVNAEIDGVMDSYIESDDGTMKELYIPSGSESGLKIKTKLTLVEGEQSEYTIDFDLRRSLHMADGENSGKLKPSLRMVDNKESSSIDGLVSDTLISEACGEGQVGAIYAYEGKDVVPTDHSDEEGGPIASALVNTTDEGYKYELGFLKRGEYTLAYTCDAGLDTPDAVEALNFLNVTSIDLQAKRARHLDMTSEGEDGRNEEHGDDEDYKGFGHGSWGQKGGSRNGGYSDDETLSEEDKAAREAAFEAKLAEFEAKKAEWDALTEEEKAAMQAEWEAEKAAFEDAGKDMGQGERFGNKKGELTEEEQAAMEAERDAKQAEWDALTEEEKAAMQAEWDAKKSEWDALTEEEKAAKKAEWKESEADDDSAEAEEDSAEAADSETEV